MTRVALLGRCRLDATGDDRGHDATGTGPQRSRRLQGVPELLVPVQGVRVRTRQDAGNPAQHLLNDLFATFGNRRCDDPQQGLAATGDDLEQLRHGHDFDNAGRKPVGERTDA